MTYDTIVIGAGSAGMPAAIYAERFGLSTLVLGAEVGGLLNLSHNVENYPGFASIPGLDLMMKFKEHVESLGIPMKTEWVKGVRKDGEEFVVETDKESYRGRTVILTTGTKHRHLGVDGEERLSGKGVSYCATCDAAFFKNVPVAVVGGGDSAAQGANLLAQHASRVYLVVRKDHLRAEPLNRKRLESNEKITVLYETNVTGILGDQEVTGVTLSKPHEGKEELAVTGVFIEIGADVQNELAKQLGVALNERGEIIIDADSATDVEGVWAAGDCADRKFKQAITGAAEGVIAAFNAYDYLQRKATGKGATFSY